MNELNTENTNGFFAEEKKKRKRFSVGCCGFFLSIVIAVVIASVASSAFTAYSIFSTDFSETDDKIGIFERKLSQIDELIDEFYFYDIDENEMMENAVAAYVEGLDEPYTHYYNKEDFESYTSELEDTYVGIGVVISANENGFIEVVAPFEGSPAYAAGILPGDFIISVNGVEYSADEMDAAVSVIRGGEAGTTVELVVIRDGNKLTFTVERGSISAESVTTEMLDNGIGYVRISSFNTHEAGSKQDTYTEFKEKVNELTKSGMKKMIIDLRDNPGGALDVVCDIADMIVPEGTITYIQYKDGEREDYTSDANEMNIPIAVLINENSASASEVLTGCLKDYKKATVIGKTSYGKGVVQTVFPFPDGSGMSMTIANYFSPNGTCIHGTGIAPDIEVDLPEEYEYYYASAVPIEDDTQLQKAIEVLNQ